MCLFMKILWIYTPIPPQAAMLTTRFTRWRGPLPEKGGLTLLDRRTTHQRCLAPVTNFTLSILKSHRAPLFGVKILMGSELNILDYTGRIDLREGILERLDYTIASIHEPCYKCDPLRKKYQCLFRGHQKPLCQKLSATRMTVVFLSITKTVMAAPRNITRCWSSTAVRRIRRARGFMRKKTTGLCWNYVNSTRHLSSSTVTPTLRLTWEIINLPGSSSTRPAFRRS